jgi:hypothetical protein
MRRRHYQPRGFGLASRETKLKHPALQIQTLKGKLSEYRLPNGDRIGSPGKVTRWAFPTEELAQTTQNASAVKTGWGYLP